MSIEIVIQILAILSALGATMFATLSTLAVTVLIFIFKLSHGEMIRSINSLKDDFNAHKKEERIENSDIHKRIDGVEKSREDDYRELKSLIEKVKVTLEGISVAINRKKK